MNNGINIYQSLLSLLSPFEFDSQSESSIVLAFNPDWNQNLHFNTQVISVDVGRTSCIWKKLKKPNQIDIKLYQNYVEKIVFKI